MDLTSSPGHLNHQFVAEDAATLRAATEMTPNDMNGPMNELVNIILAAQIVPNANIHTQVLAALQALFLKRDGDSGVIRTITPAGGARVRELGDIANAATVGGIEIGISYNCNIDSVTGVWAGRDVADICWLEKWSDAGGLKEIWYASTAAAGAVPNWVCFEYTDLVSSTKTVNGKIVIAAATLASHALQAGQLIGNNLAVNGCRQVDQLNSGTATTPTNGAYPIDNVMFTCTQASKMQAQQVTNALNSLGATHALKYTVLAPYAALATDNFCESTPIEGLNFAHLQWGTAYAQPISLQLKVNSSVAGTYSGAVQNAAKTRSYPFSFVIATANVDQLIQLPNIPGDTAGVWPTTNVTGAYISIDLGSGANFKTAEGAWAAGNYTGVTGAAQFVGQANGSTLSITDVQLEKGTFCTTLDRSDKDVLRYCQRYLPFFRYTSAGQTAGTSAQYNTMDSFLVIPFKTSARIAPTGVVASAANLFQMFASSTVVSTNIALATGHTEAAELNITIPAVTAKQPVLVRSNIIGYIYFTGAQI